MAYLPRVGATGLGLCRASIRLSQTTTKSPTFVIQNINTVHNNIINHHRLPSIIAIRFYPTATKAQEENLEHHKEKCISDPAHFKSTSSSSSSSSSLQVAKTEDHLDRANDKNEAHHTMSHPIWTEEEARDVEITHEKPSTACTWTAYIAVMTMRRGFDFFSGSVACARMGV